MFPTRAHVVMAWRQSGLLERTWVSLSYGFATPKVFDLCLSISLLILSHFHHLVCPTVAFCLSSNLLLSDDYSPAVRQDVFRCANSQVLLFQPKIAILSWVSETCYTLASIRLS